MAHGDRGSPERRRRKLCVIFCAVAVLLIIIVALALGLTLSQNSPKFKHIFTERCEYFQGYDCEKVWAAFEQAYVGRDPCDVPMEAYDPFIAAASFKPACNRMMFWSKTNHLAHDFTEKKVCFVTVEDTILGNLVDGLTWCGKEGSSETFTTGCPGWTECENNTVRSFWNRASAAFAEGACGNVTVMLNGSITTPFSPLSVFGKIEVPRFNPTRVGSLEVVLVTQKNSVSTCTNESLKDLQEILAKGIKYNCKEVAEAHIRECSYDKEKPCGPCW